VRGEVAFAALMTALALGGCATAKEIYTADGRKGYAIRCPSAAGIQNDWSKCIAKAGDMCGARGYDVLERSADESLERDMNGKLVTGQTRVMIIQCRGA
jgi:hypothetical protein